MLQHHDALLGGEVKAAFTRMCEVLRQLDVALRLRGDSFMHSARLGYLSTDPANLGTGLRVRLLMRLPLLCARDDVEDIVRMLRLTMHRGVDGMMDLSNGDHLGRSEVELANNVIHAAEKLIALEQTLEQSNFLGFGSILEEITTVHAETMPTRSREPLPAPLKRTSTTHSASSATRRHARLRNPPAIRQAAWSRLLSWQRWRLAGSLIL